VIRQRGGRARVFWLAALLVLVPTLATASLRDVDADRLDEQLARVASPAQTLPEAAPAPKHFDRLPKTRVRGLALGLTCAIGGDDGLTCGTRRAYATAYGATASDPLLYAKARFYDPETARFTSQDSYLGKPDDPPSLHRYFYANDRPTYFVDPTGHNVAPAGDPMSERMTPEQTREFLEETGRGVANVAKGWARAALAFAASRVQRIPKALYATVSPVGALELTRDDLTDLYQGAKHYKEGVDLVRNAPSGTVAGTILENTDEFQQHVGGGVFDAQGIAATGYGGIGMLRGLLKGAPVPATAGEVSNLAPARQLSAPAGEVINTVRNSEGVYVPEWEAGTSTGTAVAMSEKAPLAVPGTESVRPSLSAGGRGAIGLLTTGNTTSRTLNQVRSLGGEERWQGAEEYVRELYGSQGERHYPIPSVEGSHPVTGTGGRFVDAPVDLQSGGTLANEVKTYRQWITRQGTPQRNLVPLNEAIEQQIHKEIWLRRHMTGYDPRWLFIDAGPSQELADRLARERISTVQYK